MTYTIRKATWFNIKNLMKMNHNKYMVLLMVLKRIHNKVCIINQFQVNKLASSITMLKSICSTHSSRTLTTTPCKRQKDNPMSNKKWCKRIFKHHTKITKWIIKNPSVTHFKLIRKLSWTRTSKDFSKSIKKLTKFKISWKTMSIVLKSFSKQLRLMKVKSLPITRT